MVFGGLNDRTDAALYSPENLKEPYPLLKRLIDMMERNEVRAAPVSLPQSQTITPDHIVSMRDSVSDVVPECGLEEG